MIDMVAGWLGVIEEGMALFKIEPHHIGAVLLGLVLSWSFTQRIKRAAGMSRRETEICAFVLAFLATLTALSGFTLSPFPFGAFWTAIAVGLAAPLLYKLLIAIAGARWQWVANLRRDEDDDEMA